MSREEDLKDTIQKIVDRHRRECDEEVAPYMAELHRLESIRNDGLVRVTSDGAVIRLNPDGYKL